MRPTPSRLHLSLVGCLLVLISCLRCSSAQASWVSGGVPASTAAFAGETADPRILADASGFFSSWTDSRNHADWHIYLQRVSTSGDVQTGWPAQGLALCTAPGSQSVPVPVPDGAGGAIVLWNDNRVAGVHGLYATRCSSAGALDGGWPADGRLILAGTGYFQAATDGAGGAFIAAGDRVYRMDGTGAMASGWNSAGVSYCGNAPFAGASYLIPDGAGGILIAWMTPNYSTTPNALLVRHVLSNGALDPAWPADPVNVGPTNGPPASNDDWWATAPDLQGGVLVAWQATNVVPHNRLRVRVARISGGSGIVVYNSVATTVNCNQVPGSVASDGAGGAFVTWRDSRVGADGIYAQHVTSTGARAAGRNQDGSPAAVGPGSNDDKPKLALDGTGGIYVSWMDTRTGDFDVFATRISGSGALASGWPVNGLGICTAIHQQVDPRIVENGSGGAYLAWKDARSDSNFAVYSQCIDENGAPCSGAAAGVPLSAMTSRIRILEVGPIPARGNLKIEYYLPTSGPYSIDIFSAEGGRAARIVAGTGASGRGSVIWSGRSEAGNRLPAGIYVVRLSAGGGVSTHKIALLQ